MSISNTLHYKYKGQRLVIVSQKITSLRQFKFFTENMAWRLLSTYTGFVIFTYGTRVHHKDCFC